MYLLWKNIMQVVVILNLNTYIIHVLVSCIILTTKNKVIILKSKYTGRDICWLGDIEVSSPANIFKKKFNKMYGGNCSQL